MLLLYMEVRHSNKWNSNIKTVVKGPVLTVKWRVQTNVLNKNGWMVVYLFVIVYRVYVNVF